MIGIDTVPTDDAPPDECREQTLHENPEDLLRRLEEEKQEWQKQLAAMKEALDAQDRKIEEDRSKRKEYLEKEEQKKKIVPVKAATGAAVPTRTYRVNLPGEDPLSTSTTIPTITERARTIWPGITEFHTRRARGVAKAAPMLAADLMTIPGLGPTRYIQNQPGASSIIPSPGMGALAPVDALRAHNSQEFTLDANGRISRPAKVLNVAASSSIQTGGSTSALATVSQVGAGLAGATLGVSQQNMLAIGTTAYRRPAATAAVGGVPTTAYPASPAPELSTNSWSSWFPLMGSSQPAQVVASPIPVTQYRIA